MSLKERLRGYRDDLERRGGRRLLVDIEPEANEALKRLQASGEHGKSLKEVVSSALVAAAASLPGA